MTRAYGDAMLRTAGPSGMRHLEQRLANDDLMRSGSAGGGGGGGRGLSSDFRMIFGGARGLGLLGRARGGGEAGGGGWGGGWGGWGEQRGEDGSPPEEGEGMGFAGFGGGCWRLRTTRCRPARDLHRTTRGQRHAVRLGECQPGTVGRVDLARLAEPRIAHVRGDGRGAWSTRTRGPRVEAEAGRQPLAPWPSRSRLYVTPAGMMGARSTASASLDRRPHCRTEAAIQVAGSGCVARDRIPGYRGRRITTDPISRASPAPPRRHPLVGLDAASTGRSRRRYQRTPTAVSSAPTYADTRPSPVGSGSANGVPNVQACIASSASPPSRPRLPAAARRRQLVQHDLVLGQRTARRSTPPTRARSDTVPKWSTQGSTTRPSGRIAGWPGWSVKPSGSGLGPRAAFVGRDPARDVVVRHRLRVVRST